MNLIYKDFYIFVLKHREKPIYNKELILKDTSGIYWGWNNIGFGRQINV